MKVEFYLLKLHLCVLRELCGLTKWKVNNERE